MKLNLEAKDVLPNKPHTGRRKGRKMPLFVLVTMTFKLVQARDQRDVPCEFGTNLFSSFQDILYTNKKQNDGAKKQNLPQFTACDNKLNIFVTSYQNWNLLLRNTERMDPNCLVM